MTDPIVMTLTLIMVGQILLSVPVLLVRASKSVICLPLALFLLAIGTIAMLPIVNTNFPNWYQLYSAVAFPCLFVLCPSIWFYVEGITAEKSWKLNIKQARHFILLWPALLISIMIMFLPKAMHTEIFIDDIKVSTPFVITLMVSLLVIMLLWLGQCVYTTLCITRRLIAYRKQLKNVFSNNDDKELHWMNWLLFVAISSWLFSLATLLSSNLFDNFLFNIRTESMLSLLLIWGLAHFGLQQKPALSEYNENATINLTSENDNEDSTELSPPMKYQRSALDTEQSNRIANKINDIMRKDKLYLDSSLSLQKLASYVSISPNYISQTLNETLSTNFFDFINQWRIEAAKPKILANQDTVLNIALEVGFNAKSSFYKAFKQETGQTPSEFRKQYI
ncbi:AraC family transcriptional regulator [Colwellia sp. Arc7-635]|uniref:helix-turn-helix domain-containing protein n=1 Tax=Colwellia sp. Arc7-635 TaxID=2497879 RepID=UPI000F854490|nr:AraC family transcriptional regulator [Colwellia sp. Arc7-635]AZQ83152.1 AraC family transcriptional regulator [Colwellia sp. Arc7-635]